MPPSDTTEAYYALIEELIAEQERIWGESAIEIANSVSGLVVSDTVSDADDIWVNGNGRRIASDLAEAYVDRFGEAAASSLRETAYAYRHAVDLPPVFQS